MDFTIIGSGISPYLREVMVTLGSVMVNLRLAGVLPDAARWPAFAAFTQRMHGRPSFEAVIGPVRAAVGKRWVDFD